MSTPTNDTTDKTADEHLQNVPVYDNNLNSPSYETVDTGTEAAPPVIQETPEERAQRLQFLQEELIKVEEEILTLRQVLGAKVRRAAEIKRQMGITPFQEFKQDLQHGIKSIQDSDAYQKTSSVVKTASEKTTAAFSTVGSTMSRKLSDVRNSTAFKSMEEKVGGAVANVKAKVSGSKSETNFEEALQEETMGANSEPTGPLPEEKIPL